jgi:hypothetical protein
MPRSFYMTKIKILSYFMIFVSVLPLIYTSATNFCKKDEECEELNYCIMDENKCVHKKIFSDLTLEFPGLIMIVIGSALSNAGGIGGGGLLIPILLLVLKFYTHEAIPISKLMIFTGALTSFILGFRQKHPVRNSITIDYNIPLLLVPMLLFGTMVGVTLNKVTPPWLILISLTAVLIINTYKTLKKGVQLFKEENNSIRDTRELSNTANNSVKIAVGDINNETRNFSKNNYSYNKENRDGKYNKEYNFELHSGIKILFKIIKIFVHRLK